MEAIISSLLELLDELYVGSAGKHTWVIDMKPGHGFTKTIEQIDAAQASTPTVKGVSVWHWSFSTEKCLHPTGLKAGRYMK
jgi:hypothetical protein